jgi:hypothetical protein
LAQKPVESSAKVITKIHKTRNRTPIDIIKRAMLKVDPKSCMIRNVLLAEALR